MASPTPKDLHATTQHGGGHGGGSVFPPFNKETFSSQLIWLALTFTALYLLMSRVALPRIAEVVEGRRERIQRDIAAAEKLKTDTEKALAAYEQAHADARAKAGSIAKETHDRIAAETERDRSRVDGEMNTRIAEAEARIAANKAKAMASVTDIAADVAGTLVGKLVGTAPTADEVRKALAK
mgnify:CR=1 FL=1